MHIHTCTHICPHKPVHLLVQSCFHMSLHGCRCPHMLLGIHALARTHTMIIVILNKLLCLTFLTFRTGALDRDLKWIKGNNVVEVWGNLESAIVIIHAVNCKITPKTIFLVPILLPPLKPKPHPCIFWIIALASSLGTPFALLPPYRTQPGVLLSTHH